MSMGRHTDMDMAATSEPRRPAESVDRPLTIAIIGAGIGGLAAAVGLRREGHHVQLFEQSRFAGEIGAAVHLAPNGNGLLRRWGIFAEDFGSCRVSMLRQFRGDGTEYRHVPTERSNARWQHPWYLVQRSALHGALLRAATGADGPGGPPAPLRTSSRVVGVDPDCARVTLESGEVFEADAVIGADGIYSKSRRFVVTAHEPPQVARSGKAAFRFLLSRRVALADPITRPYVDQDDTLTIWYGTDRRVIMYPVDDNTTLNFVCIHPDSESHATFNDEWNKKACPRQAVRVYRDFCPGVRALLAKVGEDDMSVWQILDMGPLESWTRARLALLGDAAHPFTPYQGQGACQAIEDAATIATVLGRGTRPADLPDRLRLYGEIRMARVHKIQEYSRLVGRDWVGGRPSVQTVDFSDYNFGHDELDHSYHMLQIWLAHRRGETYWPIKAAVGPRPVGSGKRAAAAAAIEAAGSALGGGGGGGGSGTMKVTRITFTSSRTYLETLFPTAAFRFTRADTACRASLVATQQSGESGGGGGKITLGLCLHGVEYRSPRGERAAVAGRYVPLVFEDRWASGEDNDEGLPRLECDMATAAGDSGWNMTLSCQGVVLARLSVVADLSAYAAEPASPETGEDGPVMTYRHVPGTAAGGDSEDWVLSLAEPAFGSSSCSPARSASFLIDVVELAHEGCPAALAQGLGVLGKIPVYAVEEVRVTTGQGGGEWWTAVEEDMSLR